MATCTQAVGTADTGNTPNTSGAFTPALNDLLIVFVVASAVAPGPGDTLTSSVGMTFTRFGSGPYATNVNMIFGYVSDALVSNTASQTVTFDQTSDPANGTNIFVFRVSGMSKTGSAAVKQFKIVTNQGAGGTPAATFDASCLTNNPTLAVVGNNSSPAGLTPPTSWTETATIGDIGYSTPTTGGEVVFRDSGFTGTTITWGSTSATVFGVLAVELDTSVPFLPPPRSMQPFLAQ